MKIDWLVNLMRNLSAKFLGTQMTGSELQAHNLNVAETMRQEQRQEDFYNQYQSIGAQVRQYQEAGLNPALMAGGVSVSSPASAPSASPASAAPSGDPIQAILGTIAGVRALKSQAQDIQIKADENRRENEEHERKMRQYDLGIWKQEFDNAHYEELYNLDKENKMLGLDKLRSDISKVNADVLKTYTDVSKEEVETDILIFQRFMASIDAETHQQLVDLQMQNLEADTKLKAATTNREYNEAQKLLAEVRNLDEKTATEKINQSKLRTETKKLAIEVMVAHRTQDTAVEQAVANLAKTDSETVKNAVSASHDVRTKGFDVERGKSVLKRAARNTVNAAQAVRTGKD